MLTGLLKNSPSSATLRNEMNDLCNLGLLFQPHISAGRIPTSSGYKLYVDSLMKNDHLSENTRNYIGLTLSSLKGDPQEMPSKASEFLSNLTGLPSIFSYTVNTEAYLKGVRVMPIGKRGAVILLLTSDGRSANSVCRFSEEVTDDLINEFNKLTDEHFKHRSLSEFTPALLQNISAWAGNDPFRFMPFLTSLFDIVESLSHSRCGMTGCEKLYNFCDERSAYQILMISQNDERLGVLLETLSDETSVEFGSETGLSELHDKAIIASKYYCKGRYCGKIGVIGPDRMSYEQIIPSIKYTAEKLSEMLTTAVSDMED